ncbi:hypothetical protein QA634_14255 [Methylobacterium sp. CB376]|nr:MULTISPECIES: hypothetical protein [Methylobacterium]WFT82928.1 hypothetical protein QA634_14255 [Methylobacterium nodulans]
MRLITISFAFLPFLVVLIVSAIIAAIALPFRALASLARGKAHA